jgi:ribonuclease M5
MIKISEAIIVEGKYDKIKLSSIVDAVIIITNGFGIFKDTEKLELIRYYARKTGIIILTDSDAAGRKIRGYIKSAVNDGKITNVYIPDILGKEKRKVKPSAEGKLGVEGIETKILLEAFSKSGITASERAKVSDITKLTLYELGLSGSPNSRELRTRLQESLGLPHQLSAGALIEVLCTMMDSEELKRIINKIKEKNNGI